MRPYALEKIPFYKLSPGGNTTLLIPARAVPVPQRPAVARQLMDSLHLGAEQVGFIDLPAEISGLEGIQNPEIMPGLTMMGGEFCGNACRCLAALLVMLAEKEPETWPVLGSLRSSGAERPVAWRVRPTTDGAPGLDAAVRVDLAGATVTELEPGLCRVDMPGIVHILLDENLFPAPADLTAEAAQWRQKLGLENQPGVGCIRHAPLNAANPYIAPLVWIRDTDSSCPETACGSGSLALGLALRAHGGQSSINIRQPSGEYIAVELEENAGGVWRGWIGGPVRLIATGEAFL